MSDEAPPGWAGAPVGEVINDFQPGIASGKRNIDGGVPHLRMNNIGLGGGLVLDLFRIVLAMGAIKSGCGRGNRNAAFGRQHLGFGRSAPVPGRSSLERGV